MYESHFNFSAQPFKLSPDPKFFFGSKSHNKAMSYLHYGLRQAEGFIVITGEIGAGKSMLIGHLLDQLDRSNVVAAHLLTPNLKPEDLLSHVLSAFNIEPASSGKAAEIEAFEDFLFDRMNRGRRVLLIVDEAQNLPAGTIEELRILSNLEYGGTPLFQVFLVGQPEFKAMLGRIDMEQLRQRVIASYHLEPLNAEETRDYVLHRLNVVGWDNNPSFSEAAFELIHEAARGVPRQINKLCNRLLLFCSIDQRDAVDEATVRTVVADLAAEDVSGSPMTLSPALPLVATPDLEIEMEGDAPAEVTPLAEEPATFVNGSLHEVDDDLEEGLGEDLVEDVQVVDDNKDEEEVMTLTSVPVGQDDDTGLSESDETVVEVVEQEPAAKPITLQAADETVAEEADNTPTPPAVEANPEPVGTEVAEPEPGPSPELGAKAGPAAVAIGAGTMSVLDRLKANRQTKEKAISMAAATASSPVTSSASGADRPTLNQGQPRSATIEDVADALAKAGLGSRADESDQDQAGDVEEIDLPKLDTPMQIKEWRKSIVRYIEDARVDLRSAHTAISKLRGRVDELEERRSASKDRIVASLSKAEGLLSKIRAGGTDLSD